MIASPILIVDDPAFARQTLRRRREEFGPAVSEARQGLYGGEALAQIQARDPAAKVIVAAAHVQRSTAPEMRTARAMGIPAKPARSALLEPVRQKILEGGDAWT